MPRAIGFLKKCSKCGWTKHVRDFCNLQSARDGKYSQCRECKNEYDSQYTANKRQKCDWDWYIRRKYSAALYRAKKENLPICSLEEFMALFAEQFAATNGKCPQTGIGYDMVMTDAQSGPPFAPSPDQREPGQGYTVDNIQFLCTMYNRLKMDYPTDDVEKFIKAAAAQRGWLSQE